MSKLIDFFNRVSGAGAPTMGFLSRKAAAPIKKLALIAVTGVPAEPCPKADAVLVRPGEAKLTAAALKEIAAKLGDAPWGVTGGGDKAPKGSDFVVVPVTGLTAAVPQDEDTGKLIEVDSSMDDGLLRAVNDLPVDAAIVADALEDSGPLTWHRLMIFAHVRHLITKPLVVPVAADISDADIKSLWNAGADGIMVAADAARLAALANSIAALPPRELPKKNTSDALLPRASSSTGAVTEVEPEEPDEDDDWE